jgi:uncharacterized repeat protein (TIGR03987 family)
VVNPGTAMLLALVAYSTGVWAERFAGVLRPWHLPAFWLGLAADTWGTDQMFRLAAGWHLTLHALTGAIALALMAVHAVWATAVILRQDSQARARFHRISITVWAVWLVPFLTGALMALRRRT